MKNQNSIDSLGKQEAVTVVGRFGKFPGVKLVDFVVSSKVTSFNI